MIGLHLLFYRGIIPAMSPAKRPHSRNGSSEGAQHSEAPARSKNLSREEAGRRTAGTFFDQAG
ncbi:hypothetical protein BC440_13555 [Thalassospira sp. MIT1004]|uniref:Uncharacterized protein n=1 Tax=Thalassospira xiamenensis M-5 = DSM 17429 TaxID=1123366 RepID=A0AB72UFH3_9PROT|nr:hypothetical protein TH3_14340 [Thalassospira xiamenensis M-5 = DSM 17429]OHY99006.1 hypothetical protein BC440_13555 [Thalassospira sp. MIT1004]